MKRSPLRRKTPLRSRTPMARVGRHKLSKRRLATIIEGIGDPMAETTRLLEAVRGPRLSTAKRRNKYARRERDLPYMGWVKQQPCCMVQMEAWRRLRQHPDGDRILGLWRGPLVFGGCRGAVEAHHAGEHGQGQKAPDDTCIPLCEAHHRGDDIGITRYRGPFAGWPRGAVKAWELAMVEIYRLRYAEQREDATVANRCARCGADLTTTSDDPQLVVALEAHRQVCPGPVEMPPAADA